jgi:hypothetical protein
MSALTRQKNGGQCLLLDLFENWLRSVKTRAARTSSSSAVSRCLFMANQPWWARISASLSARVLQGLAGDSGGFGYDASRVISRRVSSTLMAIGISFAPDLSSDNFVG